MSKDRVSDMSFQPHTNLFNGDHSLLEYYYDQDVKPIVDRTVFKLINVSTHGPGIIPIRKPHDVLREIHVLSMISHPNIIKLIGSEYIPDGSLYRLELPLLAFTLRDVIDTAKTANGDLRFASFIHAGRGMFNGMEHLHTSGFAHRDIKPENVMFNWDGEVILIDFATAWQTYGDLTRPSIGDDGLGGMTFAVGTGPYRAPELLFSPVVYSPISIDLWSAAVTLAELFIVGPTTTTDTQPHLNAVTLRSPPAQPGDVDIDSGDESDDSEIESAVDSRYPYALFNMKNGDIGLAASIFRLLGTPSSPEWTRFPLPDAAKLEFTFQNSRLLSTALPYLTELNGTQRGAVLQVLERHIVLEPHQRGSATCSAEEFNKQPFIDPKFLLHDLLSAGKERFTKTRKGS